MNVVQAMHETLAIAEEYGMDNIEGFAHGCDYSHLQDMMSRVGKEPFSEDKINRWLGWMQCAVVAANIGVTLGDMESINARNQ